jgi:hypothetical protein
MIPQLTTSTESQRMPFLSKTSAAISPDPNHTMPRGQARMAYTVGNSGLLEQNTSKKHNIATTSTNTPKPTLRSQSIPIVNSSNMKRTPSELQLCEEQEMADYRDYVMFSRIVDGIARQQQHTTNFKLRLDTDRTLAHIIGTRNGQQQQQHHQQQRPPPHYFPEPQDLRAYQLPGTARTLDEYARASSHPPLPNLSHLSGEQQPQHELHSILGQSLYEMQEEGQDADDDGVFVLDL